MWSDPIDSALEAYRDLLAKAQTSALLTERQVRDQLLVYGRALELRRLEFKHRLVGYEAEEAERLK